MNNQFRARTDFWASTAQECLNANIYCLVCMDLIVASV